MESIILLTLDIKSWGRDLYQQQLDLHNIYYTKIKIVHKVLKQQQEIFQTDNEESLIEGLEQQLNSNFESVNYDLTPYNWDHISLQIVAVYDKALKYKNSTSSESFVG